MLPLAADNLKQPIHNIFINLYKRQLNKSAAFFYTTKRRLPHYGYNREI